MRAEIRAAYRYLRDNKLIDYDGRQTVAIEAVRQRAMKATGRKSDKGLNNEAIRKWMGPLFQVDKKLRVRNQKL